MITRIIRDIGDIERLAIFLRNRAIPCTVSIADGATRTPPQNRLIHDWYGQIARQAGDQTPEEVRAQCKLQFGVPILRRENAAFRAEYDAAFKPLPYETKLRLFRLLDPPVTSLMTTKQLSEYADAMSRQYREAGFVLTDPEAQKYGAMRD